MMIATFEAKVYSSAVFSIKKYIEPPVTPSNIIWDSSFQLSHSHLPRLKGNIQRYATTNRSVIISAGDSPSFSSTFELAKVVPHNAAVAMASI